MRITGFRVIILTVFAGLVYSCTSLGEKLVIDTDNPIEDFLVKCKKSHKYLISHNASSYTASGKEFIAKSNEDLSCGFVVTGYRSRSNVSHPTYMQVRWDFMKEENTDDGATIKKFVHWKEKNKQAIKLYEDGYWDDKYKYVYYGRNTFKPVDEFLKHIAGCFISKEYLDIYDNTATLNIQTLKNRYYNDIMDCNRENERIRHKYGKSSDFYYYGSRGKDNKTLKQCLYHPLSCKEYKEYLPERAIKARVDQMWMR